MRVKKSTKIYAWLAVLIWMGIIFLFSSQPGDASGAASGRIVELITTGITTVFPFLEINEEALHFILRKGAHFMVYGILGILSLRAFRLSGYTRGKGFFYAWLLATVYAGFDEYYQTFVPGRSGEVTDVMIDSAGAFAGIFLYFLATVIQRPAKEGINSFQYILIQEGLEEEKQKKREAEEASGEAPKSTGEKNGDEAKKKIAKQRKTGEKTEPDEKTKSDEKTKPAEKAPREKKAEAHESGKIKEFEETEIFKKWKEQNNKGKAPNNQNSAADAVSRLKEARRQNNDGKPKGDAHQSGGNADNQNNQDRSGDNNAED
jgi:VanZ family protein